MRVGVWRCGSPTSPHKGQRAILETRHGHVSETNDEDATYRFPGHEKWEYRSPFTNRDGAIDACPGDDFYAAAIAIAERLFNGDTRAEVESLAALFLFRHYLELRLKQIVCGARALSNGEKNVPRDQVKWPEDHRHDIHKLWNEAKASVPHKLRGCSWKDWDHAFLEKCIDDFHALDPSGEYFRYGWEKKPIVRDSLVRVYVDWGELLRVMRHTHDVAEGIRSALVEIFGENEDWQEQLNSL